MHRFSQRIGEQNVRNTVMMSPLQRFQRSRPVAGDRLVGDFEAGDLRATRVVAGDRGHIHLPPGVGGQLTARCSQLAQICPYRIQDLLDDVGARLHTVTA